MGVELRVVKQDVAAGSEFLVGKPPLRAIERVRIGGIVDTLIGHVVEPSKNPVIWYAGQRQADILLAEPAADGPTRTLLYSAEGGGKTMLAAQWSGIQVLRCAERGIHGFAGATGPTHGRLKALLQAMREVMPIDTPHEPKPNSWGTYRVADNEIHFCIPVAIQFRSTKPQSGATGSAIQAMTWLWSTDDELQDSAEQGADPNIEARLRGARTSRRMCTATAKDSYYWRNFRDEKETSPDWQIQRIRYDETPFVWPEHWSRMKRNMSAREWKRRGLAQDVRAERVTYFSYSREQNTGRLPFGAKDVTADTLAHLTGSRNFEILLGHDPGELCDTTIGLKCYSHKQWRRHRWYVVFEHVTKECTIDGHIKSLRARLWEEFRIMRPLVRAGRETQEVDPSGPMAHVRIDPYGDSHNRTDKSVYIRFAEHGFQARSAAYKKGKGNGVVPKEARITMVNDLLCTATNDVWLVLLTDEDGRCVAPGLMKALELDKRDELGNAETQKKGKADHSHFLTALGYALYRLEKVRSTEPAWRPAQGAV